MVNTRSAARLVGYGKARQQGHLTRKDAKRCQWVFMLP